MNTLSSNRDKGGISWLTDILLLLALFAPIYLATIPVRPLANPDEGRYTEIPREMAQSGDLITPRLNGMPYFYKPPLFYWMQTASIKALGINRISARLPNALMALFGIAAAYCASRSARGRLAGILTAAVLGTSALYYAMAGIVTLDTTVSVFIAAAVFSFMAALGKSGAVRAVLTVSFFFFCALAVLSKGLIGALIPAATVFLWILFAGPSNALCAFRKSDAIWAAAGTAVFAAVVVPPCAAAAAANPPYADAGGMFSREGEGQGFLWYIFVHEHILRYLDPSTSMRVQPFWFFLAVAPAGFAPWVVLLPQALRRRSKNGAKKTGIEDADLSICAIWAVFVIVFFSLSSSKLAPYVLPVYPALAHIAGSWLAKVWQAPEKFNLKWISRAFIALGTAGFIAPAAAYALLLKGGKITDESAALPIFAALSLAVFAGTAVSLFFHVRGRTRPFFISVFCTIYASLAFTHPVGALVQRPSSEPLARYYNANAKDGDAVFIAYEYGDFQDLPVWLGRLTYMIGGVPKEQEFGMMREKRKHSGRFVSNEGDFWNLASKIKGDIYIAVRKKNLEYLESQMKLNTVKAAENGNLLLVKVRRGGKK